MPWLWTELERDSSWLCLWLTWMTLAATRLYSDGLGWSNPSLINLYESDARSKALLLAEALWQS